MVMLSLLAVARVAQAQDALTIAGADRETIAQLTQIVATTSGRGLPIDPVIGEARLGAMARVPGARIVTAARDVAARLEVARDALAPEPSSADIAAGAEALKYQIPAQTLRRIREARGPRPVAVHLGLLIQLVSNRVSVGSAEKTVLELIKRNATSQVLADLGNAVIAGVKGGQRPDESLEQQFKSLSARLGGAPGTSAADVLTAGSGPTKKP
jgi:hypothetical protein